MWQDSSSLCSAPRQPQPARARLRPDRNRAHVNRRSRGITLDPYHAESVANELYVRHVPYEHPDALMLVDEAQDFYMTLYGGPDETPFTIADFTAPHGAFLVGYLSGEPVASGAWRFSLAGVPAEARRPAEIKRMFVRESKRNRGFARQMLAALEVDAARAGADWMILETAQRQVAAVGLYRSAGYTPIESFGHYAGYSQVVNLGKRLGSPRHG